MVYQLLLIMSNHKARNDYRWMAGCCLFGPTTPGFVQDSSEDDVDSVADPESDDDPDPDFDEEEEDDDDDEEMDVVVESDRFLFLGATPRL